jgi:predicted phage terminase large subunit-like protein
MNLLPRGHYKTTCGTIGFSIWLLIQDQIPSLKLRGQELRILLANESATNAEKFLSTIENIFDTNELFRLLFPELLPDLPRKRWNAQEMLIRRESSWPEATIETIGVGGAAQSRHYDVIIFDDLIGRAAMDSETIMEDTINWFDYSESLFVSPVKGIAIVNGTRWSKRDLYQHILEKDKRYGVYSRQCMEDGKPIFPEEFSVAFFDDLRVKNFAHFSSQYLNSPSDPAKCWFKEEWLKYFTWKTEGEEVKLTSDDIEKPVNLGGLDIVQVFDPSFSQRRDSSRRAIVTLGMDSKQRVYLLDAYASRDTTDKVIDKLFSMHSKWRGREFGIESVALSRVYLNLCQLEAQKRKHWINFTPIKVPTTKSKEIRIRDALQEVAAQGLLYVQSNQREFIEEFLDFPQGATDDIVDAVAMGVMMLRQPASEEEESEEEKREEEILRSRNRITGY